MRRLLRGLVAVAVAGLPFVPGPPAAAASYQVRMRGYAFTPAALTVRAGATVTWTNLDQAPHDVVTTSGPAVLRSPLLERGRSWSFTFTTPGAYGYYCSVHPDMRAQVIVIAAPTPQTPTHHPGGTGAAGRQAPSSSSPSASATPAAAQPAQSPGAPPANAGTPSKSLNPMLPLVGLISAVAVFCLLLLTSRRVPMDE
jgi:plastocyanin